MSLSAERHAVVCCRCGRTFRAVTYRDRPLPEKQTSHTDNTTTAKPAQQKIVCAACHSPVINGEEIYHCPECNLPYHKSCWDENLGCAAYGCPQVECLKPKGPAFTISAEDANQGQQIFGPGQALAPAPAPLPVLTGSSAKRFFPWPAVLTCILGVEIFIFVPLLLFSLLASKEDAATMRTILGTPVIPLLLYVYYKICKLRTLEHYRQNRQLTLLAKILRITFWGILMLLVAAIHFLISGDSLWSSITALPVIGFMIYAIVLHYRKNREVNS